MINPFVVMRETEKFFALKSGSLVVNNRHKTTAYARALAMYLVREICHQSYTEIGEYFERDHSTAIHNCKKIVNMRNNASHSEVNSAIVTLTDKLIGQN